MFKFFTVRGADFNGPVLITGAGGCIGSWAIALLVKAGVKVVVYDLSEDRSRPRLLLDDAALDLVELRGHRIDLDAQPRRRFVD